MPYSFNSAGISLIPFTSLWIILLLLAAHGLKNAEGEDEGLPRGLANKIDTMTYLVFINEDHSSVF